MSSLIVRAGARQSPSHENEAAPDYVSVMSLQNADDLTAATRDRDPRDPKLASEPPDLRDPDPARPHISETSRDYASGNAVARRASREEKSMTRTPFFIRRVVSVLLGLVPWATAFGIVNDSDLDGIVDSDDNCIEIANADQRDSNEDGVGNACDGDFDGSCLVSFEDLGIMKAAFFLGGCTGDPDRDSSNPACLTRTEQDLIQGWIDAGLPE